AHHDRGRNHRSPTWVPAKPRRTRARSPQRAVRWRPLRPISANPGRSASAVEWVECATANLYRPPMAQQIEQPRPGLEVIAGAARNANRGGLPPVHLWNPPYCGDLDMRIGTDGTWFYLKTPIGRPALVKLFASVLKREGDKYFLVTPVEKCGIVV